MEACALAFGMDPGVGAPRAYHFERRLKTQDFC